MSLMGVTGVRSRRLVAVSLLAIMAVTAFAGNGYTSTMVSDDERMSVSASAASDFTVTVTAVTISPDSIDRDTASTFTVTATVPSPGRVDRHAFSLAVPGRGV